MTQLISAGLDRALRRGLALAPVVAVAAGAVGFHHARSDAQHGVGRTADQPIGFRHDLHVRGLGIDCTYCHTGALAAPGAGMPPASTCLGCHDRLWRGTRALQPLHDSRELGQPIEWESLYALPAHTRFDHGAHASAGVGCETCHGEVATMARTTRARPIAMAWCVDCHRAAIGREADALRAGATRRAAAARLTDCSTCHY
jgi:hypothetical protein